MLFDAARFIGDEAEAEALGRTNELGWSRLSSAILKVAFGKRTHAYVPLSASRKRVGKAGTSLQRVHLTLLMLEAMHPRGRCPRVYTF